MYKIMIVEDDEVISTTLKKHLEKWEYDVFCVQDFHHVLESFIEFSPDLVLLDIYLPSFDGYHWCQEM